MVAAIRSDLPDTADQRQRGVIPRYLRQRRSVVRQDNPRQIHDASSTQALQSPAHKQHTPRLSARAQSTANHDPKHLEVERGMAPEGLSKLARDGDESRECQSVSGDDPVKAAREAVWR